MVSVRVRVCHGWLGLDLGASVSFIAHCRQGIAGDWLPVAGRRYRT